MAYRYKPKKSKSKKLKRMKFKRRLSLEKNKMLFIGLVVVVIIFALVYFAPFQNLFITISGISGLSTDGYKEVSIAAGIVDDNGIVTLTSECYIITAYVEKYQANSILMGINEVVPPRPNAHDIAADSFEILGIDLIMVKITELRDNTFYGKIIVRNRNKIASLDARPSDATAIAIRTGSPIYVKESLLEENGEYIC